MSPKYRVADAGISLLKVRNLIEVSSRARDPCVAENGQLLSFDVGGRVTGTDWTGTVVLAGRTSASAETGHSAANVTSDRCTYKANGRRCPHGRRRADDGFDVGRTHQIDPLLIFGTATSMPAMQRFRPVISPPRTHGLGYIAVNPLHDAAQARESLASCSDESRRPDRLERDAGHRPSK
jgi:hypothetical protein